MILGIAATHVWKPGTSAKNGQLLAQRYPLKGGSVIAVKWPGGTAWAGRFGMRSYYPAEIGVYRFIGRPENKWGGGKWTDDMWEVEELMRFPLRGDSDVTFSPPTRETLGT